MNFQNIIFDWSGTLCNDVKYSYQATKATIKKFGGPHLSKQDYRAHFILPVHLFYQKYLPAVNASEIDTYYFKHFKPYADKASLFRGMKGLLKKLYQQDIHLFVFSTVEQNLLENLCESHGIVTCFKEIKGSIWDKEEALPLFCRTNKFDSARTLFIGDMEHDITAAHKAKISSGAILYGYQIADRLIQHHPDYAWKSPQDLYRFFTKEFLK